MPGTDLDEVATLLTPKECPDQKLVLIWLDMTYPRYIYQKTRKTFPSFLPRMSVGIREDIYTNAVGYPPTVNCERNWAKWLLTLAKCETIAC